MDEEDDRPWRILRRVVDTATGVPPSGPGDNAEEHPEVIDEAEADAQAQEEQHAGVGGAEEHVVAGDAAVEARLLQEQAEDAALEEQMLMEQSVVGVNTNQAASEQAHLAMGAGQPGYAPAFTITVAPPPRVSFLRAGPSSHPDPARPDMCPYIIAAGRFCLLAHFAVAPSNGTNFDQYPNHSNLVVVRHFLTDDYGAEIGACALHVPDRPLGDVANMPALRSMESVGLVCDQETGDYQIAELIVTTGAPQALIIYFRSDTSLWEGNYNVNPLQREDRRRDWVPHGTVTLNSTVLWFDLSWGILSCDLADPPLVQVLNFHRLPHDRVLRAGAGVPDLHCRRCIAVSENLVRYVEIILHPYQAASVKMWFRDVEANPNGWIWQTNYTVRLEDIWADESYAQTRLPQKLPMLVGVSPINPNVVYFSLNQRLFGVNVPEHRVVHCAQYEPLRRPGPRDEPVSRYFITWNLDADAAPEIGHQPDEPSDHADSSASGPVVEGEIISATPPE